MVCDYFSYRVVMENSLLQPNISSCFRSQLGQAAVSAAKVTFLSLLNYLIVCSSAEIVRCLQMAL